MHSIKIQISTVLCALLTACAQGQSAHSTTSGPDSELRREVAECRATGRRSQNDRGCAEAIAERDKAAWRSKGRGIQIKPEANQ